MTTEEIESAIGLEFCFTASIIAGIALINCGANNPTIPAPATPLPRFINKPPIDPPRPTRPANAPLSLPKIPPLSLSFFLSSLSSFLLMAPSNFSKRSSSRFSLASASFLISLLDSVSANLKPPSVVLTTSRP